MGGWEEIERKREGDRVNNVEGEKFFLSTPTSSCIVVFVQLYKHVPVKRSYM